MTARRYFIGTMGWSYEDWKGSFYGAKAQARDFLSAYSEHFDTVEVDSSFYGFPDAKTIARWCKVTPDEFLFSLKCPSQITHELALTGIQDSVPALAESLRLFEGKLGMLLFQFPPSFRATHIVRVKRLFDLLPDDLPFAVEFRHRSWLEAGAPDLAREYRVTWTISDALPDLHVTSDKVYLRLLGDHAWEPRFDHVQREVDDEVQGWSRLLIELQPQVTQVLGYVNNHYSGHSPATASRLRELLGLEPIVVYRQGKLF